MPSKRAFPVHYLPSALAVLAAAGAGGAAFGESIGTDPVVQREDRAFADGPLAADDALSPLPAPSRERYALVTAERRYETGELSARGLFSQARFGSGQEPWPSPDPGAAAAEASDYPEPAPMAEPAPPEREDDSSAAAVSPLPRLTLAY